MLKLRPQELTIKHRFVGTVENNTPQTQAQLLFITIKLIEKNKRPSNSTHSMSSLLGKLFCPKKIGLIKSHTHLIK